MGTPNLQRGMHILICSRLIFFFSFLYSKDVDVVITFPPDCTEATVFWFRDRIEKIPGILLDAKTMTLTKGTMTKPNCFGFLLSASFHGWDFEKYIIKEYSLWTLWIQESNYHSKMFLFFVQIKKSKKQIKQDLLGQVSRLRKRVLMCMNNKTANKAENP